MISNNQSGDWRITTNGANGGRRYLHTDERGSVTAVSNASGALLGINSYE